jgi:CDP-paratose 2-epimerase
MQGKQVRDNMHSFDLVSAFWCFFQRPRCAEVYNIGAARQAGCSVIEAIKMCEDLTGRPMNWSYVADNRVGDHIWWIGDVRRFQSHCPQWRLTYDIRAMMAEIHDAMRQRTR